MPSWTVKYRPDKIFKLHHRNVREQLQTFMKAGKIPQVLLFAGPKGIGKTSASRIIAALLNDPRNLEAVELAYLTNSTKRIELKEPDYKTEWLKPIIQGKSYTVMELDAASNRGINEIRAIKDRIELPPIEGTMAVYILDEAHMLTAPAFNALLKIMEEPPPHVIFVLATTQIEKIPDTIISRCQVLRFSKATDEELADLLKDIAKQEQLSVSPEVLTKISELSDGSFRDAVKLLEQLSIKDSHADNQTVATFGLFPSIENDIGEMLNQIVQKNMAKVSEFFSKWRDLNIDESYLQMSILKLLHRQLLLSYSTDSSTCMFSQKIIIFLLKAFNVSLNTNISTLSLLNLEIVALELIQKATNKTPGPSNNTKLVAEEATYIDTPQSRLEASASCQKVFHDWDEFVASISEANTQLATLFCSIKPIMIDGDKLVVGVYYKFHLEQLSKPKTVNLIEEFASNFSGGKVHFEFQLAKISGENTLDFNSALIS